MKKILTILLVISMLGLINISVWGSEPIYDDVKTNLWYSKSIELATQKGLVSGTGNNLFKPNMFITREQAAMILYNWQGDDAVYNTYHFNDVKPGAWYANAVEWMYRNGFTYGINEYEYGVGRYITRQDLVTLIYRINQHEWEFMNEDDQAKYAGRYDNIYQFADHKNVSDYAFKAVQFSCGVNTVYFQHISISVTPILWGDNHNRLNPQEYCTRAEAVEIIYRSYDRVFYEFNHH